ncbi:MULTISPECIES: AAA family ATPase [Bacillus subtilis group]|uniref:AAA family ATPase n=1 Tax=Bacillus subtilis group TaxID=653685 RepID=UPI001B1B9EDB|nr:MULTISPECIES: AAA family ATPase [Bacillus subtilis group]MED4337863.1 AAA family ATPase [Bacillus licheniformis]MED4371133.1 AAA family ATPase [Bacillus licheniformis]GIN55048.1 ATPase [Bacillus paralicheniformis]
MSILEKNMTGMDEVLTLMNSRRKSILINTYEEERFQEDLRNILDEKSMEGFVWTITDGLTNMKTGEKVQKIYDPVKLLDFVDGYRKDEEYVKAVFVLKDFHDMWNQFQAKRRLRDLLEKKTNSYKPIILVTPQLNIPMELEKLITVVTYELPSRDQVEENLKAIENTLKNKGLEVPDGRERVAIINALIGMTSNEIQNVLKKSATKHRKIVLEEIIAEKEQVIKKTGLLEYVTKLGNMDHVGGMDILKDWFSDARYAFDHEAKTYGVDPVRGCVAAGFPGTGKSLVAKSVAHMWNLPLLKMNMSDIMDSKVGQSEKNIDRALKLAEDVSPCVLWIDEFEKALSGMSSSDRSDGGTTSRVIQSLLTWLSDKDAPVFVIATANDITKLPAELTRAGRFDEIFFVSLPAQSEREDIFKIHLSKRGYNISNDMARKTNEFTEEQISRLASKSKDFTGAEIEQVIAEAGRRAYADFRKGNRETHYMKEEHILEQIERIVPLSKRNPALLQELRDWAKHSAKCASNEEHQLIHGKQDTGSSLFTIDTPSNPFDHLDFNETRGE